MYIDFSFQSPSHPRIQIISKEKEALVCYKPVTPSGVLPLAMIGFLSPTIGWFSLASYGSYTKLLILLGPSMFLYSSFSIHHEELCTLSP